MKMNSWVNEDESDLQSRFYYFSLKSQITSFPLKLVFPFSIHYIYTVIIIFKYFEMMINGILNRHCDKFWCVTHKHKRVKTSCVKELSLTIKANVSFTCLSNEWLQDCTLTPRFFFLIPLSSFYGSLRVSVLLF